MCMHAHMGRLVWSGDGTYVRRGDHGRREAKYARAHSYLSDYNIIGRAGASPPSRTAGVARHIYLLGERERAHLVARFYISSFNRAAPVYKLCTSYCSRG